MVMKGLEKHIQRIRAVTSPRGVKNISRALFVAADEMKAHAQHLITQGSVSGKGHVPSAPGQPPNADTRDLDRKIESYQPAPLLAEVRSESDHAAAMEFGTSKVAARPYMAPTREAKRGRVKELVEEAISATIRSPG